MVARFDQPVQPQHVVWRRGLVRSAGHPRDEPVRQLPPVLSYAPINMDRLLIKPTGGQAGAGAARDNSDERHTLPRPDA